MTGEDVSASPTSIAVVAALTRQ